MTTSTEMILIGGIAIALRQSGSWCGETHIQKTAYLAKSIEHLPLESEFVLYKHGPYSFDLNKSLNHMRSRKVMYLIPRERYGPSYGINTALWSALNRAAGGIFERYEESVARLCAEMAQKNVAELERIATAVYVTLNYPKLSLAARRAKLVELKPHITPELAATAFGEAQVFISRTGAQ